MLKEIKYNLIEIESVENVGYFENEYVYDIEVNESDYSDQTFFANDILVHNSNYVNFGRVLS